MLQVRVAVPSELTAPVVEALTNDPTVSALAVQRGAGLRPEGDVITADIPRETANAVMQLLLDLDVHRQGTVHFQPVRTWMSRSGYEAEQLAPGASADAVVWLDVTQSAYADSELNWTFLSFMSLATFIAAIAIVLDSPILVIGAMVLGPEFGAVAALGVALVRGRVSLLRYAARSLIVGFAVAIGAVTLLALAARWAGWVTTDSLTVSSDMAFIYTPDKWSFLVAVVAGAAGVLSVTSDRLGGLSGVFISVTTIPAAGMVALGIAFGATEQIWGSALQLVVNIVGMALAGWATLALQKQLWSRLGWRTAPRPDPRRDRPGP